MMRTSEREKGGVGEREEKVKTRFSLPGQEASCPGKELVLLHWRKKNNPVKHAPVLSLALSLLLVLAACDDSFTPVSEDKTDFFAVSGFLDTAADTHFVRVSPVRETVAPSEEPEVIQVMTTHLATGAQTVWQDSLVLLDNNRTGRLFFAQIPVGPGETYRLEVRGAEGEMTHAVTRVPPRIRLAPGPLVPGFNQRFAQRVTLLDQFLMPFRADLIYEVTLPGSDEPVTLTSFFIGTAPGPDGLQVIINLEFHREEILTRLGLPRTDSTVVLNRIGLEIEQLSAEWSAEDTPEVSGPIKNGFGFFGSVSRYTASWTLDAADLKRLGYRAPG